MDELVMALAPAFAAGFAIQQLLEILGPLFEKASNKKALLGYISLAAGLALSFGMGLRVLEPLGVGDSDVFDAIATGLIISAGTEGINSIMKYLGYSKKKKKLEAGEG